MTVYELKPGDLYGNAWDAYRVHQDYDGKPHRTRTFWEVPMIHLPAEPVLPLPKPSESRYPVHFGFRDSRLDSTEYVFRDGVQIHPEVTP